LARASSNTFNCAADPRSPRSFGVPRASPCRSVSRSKRTSPTPSTLTRWPALSPAAPPSFTPRSAIPRKSSACLPRFVSPPATPACAGSSISAALPFTAKIRPTAPTSPRRSPSTTRWNTTAPRSAPNTSSSRNANATASSASRSAPASSTARAPAGSRISRPICSTAAPGSTTAVAASCNGIYIDNLVSAIVACLHATDDAAGPYLVGDNETVTSGTILPRRRAAPRSLPWTSIHQVTRLPSFHRSWKDRAGRAAAHPFVQRLLPLVPYKLKRSAKAVLAAASPTPRNESWTLPSAPRPHITQEMALLQQCSWKFPHTRAEQHLDYHPPVTFVEGIDRSFAWWRFAQGNISFAA